MEIPKGYPYLKVNKSDDCNWICYIVIICAILFLLYPRIKKHMEGFTSERSANVDENVGILPDAMRNGLCHPKCCIQQQWPVEHMQGNDIDLTNYVQTEYSCKSCQYGSGCLCFTKEDYAKLKDKHYA